MFYIVFLVHDLLHIHVCLTATYRKRKLNVSKDDNLHEFVSRKTSIHLSDNFGEFKQSVFPIVHAQRLS